MLGKCCTTKATTLAPFIYLFFNLKIFVYIFYIARCMGCTYVGTQEEGIGCHEIMVIVFFFLVVTWVLELELCTSRAASVFNH